MSLFAVNIPIRVGNPPQTDIDIEYIETSSRIRQIRNTSYMVKDSNRNTLKIKRIIKDDF